MNNKKVRTMIASINPYVGYAIELKVRAKHVRVALVATSEVPNYLKEKWAVLTTPEYFNLHETGRDDISFLDLLERKGMVCLLETKLLPMRPKPFDPCLYNQTLILNAIASYKPFWEREDKHRAGKGNPVSIEESDFFKDTFTFRRVDIKTALSKKSYALSTIDNFIGIQNPSTPQIVTLDTKYGKPRVSEPV